MNILTLGNCCKKSKKNFENAKIAAQNCGISEKVENTGDIKEIVNYGVMATPAIVIDGKVVSEGKALDVKQIEKLINDRK